MKIIVVALGSAGDVHPLTGLALALRERGHSLLLAASPVFRDLAEGRSLPFVGIGTEDDFTEALKDPDLWHPRRGFSAVARRLILPSLRPLYDILVREHRKDDIVVVAPVTALGARVASEKIGVPLVTVHLQPVLIRSVVEPPCFGFPDILRFLPRPMRGVYFRLADRLFIDPQLAPATNDFRAGLGLPPVRRILDDWANSRRLIIGLFPPWYAPPREDWPSRVKLTGFPLYDESDTWEAPPELEAWLAAGEPPLVFTAGSAMVQGERFFRVGVEVCRRMGRRGLLLTRFPGQLPGRLPPGVRTCDYIPFSRILPRCAAIVHHGGIGTVAQALAAGIPQLVVPFAHDQPDNACRVRRLGVGDFVVPGRYGPAKVQRRLTALTESSVVKGRCRFHAALTGRKEGLPEACGLIEKLLPPGMSTA